MKPLHSNRYGTRAVHSDSEDSSHSVRVSRLIEKIKAQRNQGSSKPYVSSQHPEAFSYLGRNSSSNDLIYSRVERGDHSIGKRTVREKFVPNVEVDTFSRRNVQGNKLEHGTRNTLQHERSTLENVEVDNFSRRQANTLEHGRSTVQHERNTLDNERSSSSPRRHTPFRTTVLLNNDSESSPFEYETLGHARESTRGHTFNSNTTPRARYFGEETDYEYDRELSKSFRNLNTNNSSFGYSKPTARAVPKIILHEEAVAEIPNGKVNHVNGRSPSREFNVEQEDQGNRFLGGLLTLKRNKRSVAGSNTSGTIRSSRSPTRTYLHPQDSPKYYVPYRSTPTLYESRYERDRMSSTGGSVLSNSSYVNKHVSRSMSMKAPWEPRHRTNEINYYDESKKVAPVPENPKRNISRSKSMPGKKLSSIIGSWVSKNNTKKAGENEKLIVKPEKPKQATPPSKNVSKPPKPPKPPGTKGSWASTLLRGFGKKNFGKGERGVGSRNEYSSVGRSGDEVSSNRSSLSPVRTKTGGGRGAAVGEVRASNSRSATSSTAYYGTVDKRTVRRNGERERGGYY
ncbi:unnamed protein product [Orchesella dallaii]|uniref:Uncharacterized protein n=1 Tax=Orchesella dallaii TaxID=48710 RepID=A0ABP1PL24_9HEXA